MTFGVIQGLGGNSLDELLRKFGNIEVSYPGIAIGYELWALESALDVLETHLPQIRDQYRLRAEYAVWSDSSLVDGEISHQLQQIEETVSNVFPQYVRNPAVTGTWALLESAVEEIGDYVAKREGVVARFSKAKGRKFRARCRSHFEVALGLTIVLSEKNWTAIGRLEKFRNVLVHRNGRIDTGTDKKRKEFERLASTTEGVSLLRSRLVFAPEYVSSALSSVRRFISSLDAAVADRYDWAHLIRESSP